MARIKDHVAHRARKAPPPLRKPSRVNHFCALKSEQLEDRTVPAPVVLDPNLTVNTVSSGLSSPIGMAFLGDNDFLFLEKETGQVKRVLNGTVQSTPVLDLAVNFASERGLLSIALHPDFSTDKGVYLYWTESSTGSDTKVLSETTQLGNRVDRFVWDGKTLTQAENIAQIRAIQQDATNPVERGNHDGGVIRFGPDGKLYVFVGDVGRRGQMQNLQNGPFSPGDPLFGTDDQFGGPEPDDDHLTGVILRLNPDGTTPADNPFADIGQVFVSRLDGSQETTPNTSTAKGYATFFLNEDKTALSYSVTVAGLDFTGSQTTDLGDDLKAAHIHAPGAPGTNAGVVFGFFGTPFNETDPNDVVVTPFADGVGGTVTGTWNLTEGNKTTLADQLANIIAGNAYINFHTTEFPGGEIRGQILEDPDVAENIRKVFSYGHRNSFGMAFDPDSGDLWAQENGDDSFSELNRVEPGMNGGWVQIMGPVDRIAQFKEIETGNAPGFPAGTFSGLQQVRWSPDNIADTPEEALARLVSLPGSHYSDPEFSWKFEVAPGGIGFMTGKALGSQYQNDLFMGAATPALEGGYLFHFNLTDDREKVAVDDRDLDDRVADNLDKHDLTESESLLFGTGFGVVTDILTGPDGNLFVVSLLDPATGKGAIFEITRDTKDDDGDGKGKGFGKGHLISNGKGHGQGKGHGHDGKDSGSISFAAVGADAGGGPHVKVFDGDGNLVRGFFAFDPAFRGGVRVAVGDVNNDGFEDIVTAAGPGGGPHIRIFSGEDGELLQSFFAYDTRLRSGLSIAVGDVNGDGNADIVTAADAGGGPHVKVFSGADGSVLHSFFAYDTSLRGGVRVALGDVNNDGNADIITAAGANVKVFDGATGDLLKSFIAGDPTVGATVFIAAGDLDGDDVAEIVVGAAPGTPPRVETFNGLTGESITSFMAFDERFNGGVRVAVRDVNGDGENEIIAGAGIGGGPGVRFHDRINAGPGRSFFAFDPAFRGGVFVG